MSEYISREAAKNYVIGRYDDQLGFITMEDIIDQLDYVPAADVRPVVRGKWRLYSPLTDTYECDKCGYQVIDESFHTNFCPNCGADMRQTGDENV